MLSSPAVTAVQLGSAGGLVPVLPQYANHENNNNNA